MHSFYVVGFGAYWAALHELSFSSSNWTKHGRYSEQGFRLGVTYDQSTRP